METSFTTLSRKKMQVHAPLHERYNEILTPEALEFILELNKVFNPERKFLLAERRKVQEKLDNNWIPRFITETAYIRTGDWTIDPVPPDIRDRRVEITGPAERKMIINALNSGASVFMADLEDSNTPSWENCMEGQINLKDVVNKTIFLENPENKKKYKLNEKTATLFVRPRGWHLNEEHVRLEGEAVSASLFDFGLYFFHNAKTLVENGSGPYFYLPKLESYEEARLWNKVFVFSQDYCNIPQGTIKATVLVETILASFQLNEILWELKEHSAGLNCGRWDYIFSFIKKFRNVPGYLFPDRSQVTMTVPFMRAYTQLVIQTCHRRNAHAIGGMAAQIPIKENKMAHEAALKKIQTDKLREVMDGHDGTWVAHPGLVEVTMEIFNQHMPGQNQIYNKREDFSCKQEELLELPKGTITEEGVRHNINVGILYLESWLRGNGAAALYNMMEDAATAEICRAQVWQWIRGKATLQDGRILTWSLYEDFRDHEIEAIQHMVGSKTYQSGKFVQAISLFNKLVGQDHWEDFLTPSAYQLILSNEGRKDCVSDK